MAWPTNASRHGKASAELGQRFATLLDNHYAKRLGQCYATRLGLCYSARLGQRLAGNGLASSVELGIDVLLVLSSGSNGLTSVWEQLLILIHYHSEG